jgi:hypothetical protein
MLLAQPQRRSRVRVGFAGAHALLIVEYITPAAGLQPGVGTHQSPRTHTPLGQPPSIFSGRFPSTFTTRSHGVPHVPQRPSATMASRMSLPSPWSNTLTQTLSAATGLNLRRNVWGDSFSGERDQPDTSCRIEWIFVDSHVGSSLSGVIEANAARCHPCHTQYARTKAPCCDRVGICNNSPRSLE